jgi:signal transduction histidine kinase
VLCFPVIHHGELVCIVYLEHRQDSGLFTERSLQVLRLLASQCAISIANARLFEHVRYLKNHLQIKVDERTESLERAMKETSVAIAEASIYEERVRISQAIHDIVGHTLISTILQIESGKRLLKRDMSEGLEHLSEAQKLVRHSLNEIRGSVHMLREDRYANLYAILTDLIDETEKHTGVAVYTVIHKLPKLMSVAQKKIIYHALQEGFTNGIKHAHCTEFRFYLEWKEEQICFRLENNGSGPSTIVMGFGLKSICERVEYLGGQFMAEHDPVKGYMLSFTIPCAQMQDEIYKL